MTTLYLDTNSGPIPVSLTGKECTAPVSGVRYLQVEGWLPDPMYVSEDRLATDPAVFAQNTMMKMRA